MFQDLCVGHGILLLKHGEPSTVSKIGKETKGYNCEAEGGYGLPGRQSPWKGNLAKSFKFYVRRKINLISCIQYIFNYWTELKGIK
jgi:hypothetical protein